MGMSISSNPKVIYVQATEPTDKSQGLLWVKTSDNSVNVANGATYQNVSPAPYFEMWESDGSLNRDGSTGSQSKEFTVIANTNLSGKTYLDIDVLFSCVCVGRTATIPEGYNNILVEAKEVGGAYMTLIDNRVNEVTANLSTVNSNSGSGGNMKYIHTLTAGEKTNGIQIKITTSTGGDSNAWSNFTVTQASFTARA